MKVAEILALFSASPQCDQTFSEKAANFCPKLSLKKS
jgi:hypothetical protein